MTREEIDTAGQGWANDVAAQGGGAVGPWTRTPAEGIPFVVMENGDPPSIDVAERINDRAKMWWVVLGGDA